MWRKKKREKLKAAFNNVRICRPDYYYSRRRFARYQCQRHGQMPLNGANTHVRPENTSPLQQRGHLIPVVHGACMQKIVWRIHMRISRPGISHAPSDPMAYNTWYAPSVTVGIIQSIQNSQNHPINQPIINGPVKQLTNRSTNQTTHQFIILTNQPRHQTACQNQQPITHHRVSKSAANHSPEQSTNQPTNRSRSISPSRNNLTNQNSQLIIQPTNQPINQPEQ